MYIVPCCVFDPNTPVNILGVPDLGSFFGDNADATDHTAAEGTTILLGSIKLHFIWDHGRHKQNFMHAYSYIPELYIYVGHGYLKDLYIRVHKFLSDKVHFAFPSAYSIDP